MISSSSFGPYLWTSSLPCFVSRISWINVTRHDSPGGISQYGGSHVALKFFSVEIIIALGFLPVADRHSRLTELSTFRGTLF